MFFFSVSAPRTHNRWHASVWRFRAALCRGVSSREISIGSIEAFESHRRFIPVSHPAAAARCKGVLPSQHPSILGSAPLERSALVASRFRHDTAQCNGDFLWGSPTVTSSKGLYSSETFISSVWLCSQTSLIGLQPLMMSVKIKTGTYWQEIPHESFGVHISPMFE